MPESIIKAGEAKMEKSIESLKRELQLIRTSRANPTVLNGVTVSYYGVDTPINQIASISVPEAQLLVIKPYDKSILKDLEKAIQSANLNLTPQSDGTVIRINFPALTEVRRKELVKEVKKEQENGKVAIRNIRRDMMEELKELEKESLITEDELKRYNEKVQKSTDKYVQVCEDVCREKEASIMEI